MQTDIIKRRHKSVERIRGSQSPKRCINNRNEEMNSTIYRKSLKVDLERLKIAQKKEKEEHEKAVLYYDEHRGLIVYDINAALIYEDTRQEDYTSMYSKKERNLVSRISQAYQKSTWEKRKSKLIVSLSPDEKTELNTSQAGMHRLFPEYSKKFSILIPKRGPNSIIFSSKFECGNLSRAILVSENEYILQLRPDYGTTNYAQWFYFSANNIEKGITVTFNIINLNKNITSYMNGMKPAVYSRCKKEAEGIKWHHAGEEVLYRKISTSDTYGDSNLSMLTFKYTFEYDNDCVYFAHCIPYSYTKLEKFVKEIKSGFNRILSVKTLCYSFAMNKCFHLIISDNVEEKNNDNAKKTIIITARVHPGESNSSYIVEGFIRFLLSEDPKAKRLRKLFIFHIIPMLNPDGVIYGNYRYSLLGTDLNRSWNNPSKILNPTIFHAKELIRKLSEKSEILAFCDLHGHSSSKDIFILGCQSLLNEGDYYDKNKKIRLFARVLSKICPSFSLLASKYSVEKNKLSTGRVVIFKEFGILQSYTIETSCYGSDGVFKDENYSQTERAGEDCHFTISDLQKIGKTIALAYLIQIRINDKEISESGLDKKFLDDAIEAYGKTSPICGTHNPGSTKSPLNPVIVKKSNPDNIAKICRNSRNLDKPFPSAIVERLYKNLSRKLPQHKEETTTPISTNKSVQNGPLSIVEFICPNDDQNAEKSDTDTKNIAFYNRLKNILAQKESRVNDLSKFTKNTIPRYSKLPEIQQKTTVQIPEKFINITNPYVKKSTIKSVEKPKYKTRISLDKYVKEFKPETGGTNCKSFYVKQGAARKTPTDLGKNSKIISSVTKEATLDSSPSVFLGDQVENANNVYRSMNMRWQLRKRKQRKTIKETDLSTIIGCRENPRIEANGMSCSIFFLITK